MADGDPEATAAPPLDPTPAGPTGERQRIVALDVLRGVAILGILPVNVLSFALPAAVIEDAVHFMSPARSEAWAHGLLQTLVSYKFITIFALLFGAGLALQRSRAGADASFYPRTGWRLALLAGLGLLHAFGLWHGDVLFFYATIGAVALALSWFPTPALLALGVLGAVVIPSVVLLLVSLVPVPVELGPRTLEAALAAPDAAGAVGSVGIGREVEVFRGGTYLEMLGVRAVHWLYQLGAMLMIFGWRVAGLFFLGIAAERLGLLRPDERGRRVLRWMLVLGLVIGLPVELWQATVKATGPVPYAALLRVEAAHQVGSLALALAYAAGVLLLPAAWLPEAPLRWLSNVGRLALTNYLGQTVICTTIFYAYGLGWFATLTRVQLWGVAVAVWVVQLALSALWLRWFVMGPVEWAWRSLTWLKVQPLRR
ncbi:MAG: DUF418 domain-containing protein [Planctomycetes bacterium]|nr:DUF418 domain-containing protein [Planctomycetota bacterium]